MQDDNTPRKALTILGIRGVPAAHGGFESFAERLAPWLAARGWEVTVYCQGSTTGKRYEDTWMGCKRIHIPVIQNGALGTIEFDIKSTFDSAHKGEVLLILGYNTAFLSIFSYFRKAIQIINMDGIEWKRNKYNRVQRIYLWLNERIATRFGDVLVADHPEIARHHRRTSSRVPIVMIPYGADEIDRADDSVLKQYNLIADQYFTVIARPEPENSILEIVRAFSSKRRGVNLAVLGNYDENNSYQRAVKDCAGEEVIFLGAIYDKTTLQALRLNNIAYIHGHQVGGTNPSLVEAMGAGSCVLAHDNQFNRWVAGEAGLYFSNELECREMIEKLLQAPSLRKELKLKSKERWSKNFTWEEILEKYRLVLERMTERSSSELHNNYKA